MNDDTSLISAGRVEFERVSLVLIFFVLCLSALFFPSCRMVNGVIDGQIDLFLSDMDVYYGDFGTIETERDVWEWVEQNIEFVDTNDVFGFPMRATPMEIVERGYGNCNQFAILISSMLYTELGVKSNFLSCAVGDSAQRTVVHGGRPDHAMIEMGGVHYQLYRFAPVTDSSIKICYRTVFDVMFPDAEDSVDHRLKIKPTRLD